MFKRHDKPAAAVASREPAKSASEAIDRRSLGLVAHLRAFPEVDINRDPTPSRDVDLGERCCSSRAEHAAVCKAEDQGPVSTGDVVPGRTGEA